MSTTKNELSEKGENVNPDKGQLVFRFIMCILAHVDHGKTSVADSLLAMAGIVNPNFVGDTRYLDSRPDEQAKGITLKSSVFSMMYQPSEEKYIFTVVDTPGHIDFSKEVSSVVKSCDGAVIVVDVVEGILAQTREAIKIAMDGGLKMILIINKYDRLILNKKQSFDETCFSILRLLESTNDVLVDIFEERLKVRSKDDEARKNQAIKMAKNHLFAFEKDNVIIGSSLDGWGILPRDMLKLFLPKDDKMDAQSKKNLEKKVMSHFCDPDYYYSSHHTVRQGAIKKGYDSMFMVMVVKTLYYVYDTLMGKKEISEVAKIAGRLKIKNITSEMRSNSSRTQLRAIMRSFAQLGETIMRAAILVVPEARDIPIVRMRQMIRDTPYRGDINNLDQIAQMMSDFEFSRRQLNDSPTTSSQELATYAYISKLMSVKRSDIIASDSMKEKLLKVVPSTNEPAPAAAIDDFIAEMDGPNPSSSYAGKRESLVFDVRETTPLLKSPKSVQVNDKIRSKTSKGLKFRKNSAKVQKISPERTNVQLQLNSNADGATELAQPSSLTEETILENRPTVVLEDIPSETASKTSAEVGVPSTDVQRKISEQEIISEDIMVSEASVSATVVSLKISEPKVVLEGIMDSEMASKISTEAAVPSIDVQPKISGREMQVALIPHYGYSEIMDGKYQLPVPDPELPVVSEDSYGSNKSIDTPMFADNTVEETNLINKSKEDVIIHSSACTSASIEKKNDQPPVKLPTLPEISTKESSAVRMVPKVTILEQIIFRPGEISNVEYETINQSENGDISSAGGLRSVSTGDEEPLVTIAIIRIFFGKIQMGDHVTLLQSAYKPPIKFDNKEKSKEYNAKYMVEFQIKEIYILNGRDIILTDKASAGCICGIRFDHTSKDGHLLRTGTIVNNIDFYPIYELPLLDPVLSVCVAPRFAKHMHLLAKGLTWLQNTDPSVKVRLQENGQYVILATGDVHMSKLTTDLANYVRIELKFEDPIVSFRETVINPKEDDVGKTIAALQKLQHRSELKEFKFFIELHVMNLPNDISCFIEENIEILKLIEDTYDWGYIRKRFAIEAGMSMRKSINKIYDTRQMESHSMLLQEKFKTIVRIIAKENLESKDTSGEFSAVTHSLLARNIWSVGHLGMPETSNLLINKVSRYRRSIFDTIDETDKRSLIDSCIVKAFNETTKVGPICGEPLANCGFVITDFNIDSYDAIMASDIAISTITSQITNACITAMKEAFLKQKVQLMEPMFETEISLMSSEQSESVMTIVKGRKGKVIEATDIPDEPSTFRAYIPALQCADFADAVRNITSGYANPYLRFNKFEIVEGDPLDDIGDDEEQNSAYEFCTIVRKRKGLHAGDEVVEKGEKQKTLSKKK